MIYCKDCEYFRVNNDKHFDCRCIWYCETTITCACPYYDGTTLLYGGCYKCEELDADIKIYDPKVKSINTDLADRKNHGREIF